MDWLSLIINAVVTLLGIGGIGWLFTVREDKRAKQLENEAKEDEIKEHRKDDIISDWKEIAQERKERAEKMAADIEEIQNRSRKKDEIISELRNKLDERNTYCAISELLKCQDIQCANRKPSFASTVVNISDSLTTFVNDKIK